LSIVATPFIHAITSNAPVDSPQKIELVNLKDLSMPTEQQQDGGQEREQPAAPAVLVMPTMPPSRDIKESVVPPERK
jgi:hypothetical protein